MKKIHSTRVLHDGWEMDNELWIIEHADGSRELRGTSHGLECVIEGSELHEKIAETQRSLEGLLEARRLIHYWDKL